MATLKGILVLLICINAFMFVSAKVCGNGRLEASLESIESGGTTYDACADSKTGVTGTPDPETCDVSDDAGFGVFNAGCGSKTLTDNDASSACKYTAIDFNQHPDGMVPEGATDEAKRAKQVYWSALTHDTTKFDYNPHEHSAEDQPHASVCLYSDTAIKDDGTDATDLKDAAGCKITPEMYTKYTSLSHCIDTGNTDEAQAALITQKSSDGLSGLDINALKKIGSQLTTANDKFQQYGHKCQVPLSVRMGSPVHGEMTWEDEDWDSDNFTPPRMKKGGNNKWPGVHDMCFSISDSNWPSVHHSSREFTAQASRMTYEVHCDPLDQFTSFPDDTNDCEDTSSTMPGQTSHKCPRLGGLKHPCFENELQWELMVCDESDGNADNHWCESLAGKREVLENRFVKDGVTYDNEAIKPGVKYVFEHDNSDDQNPFMCSNKAFDNTELFTQNLHHGDSTAAQFPYICKTGGQDTACGEDLGEIVHHIDTCSAQGMDRSAETEYRPITAFGDDAKLGLKRWCKSDGSACQESEDTDHTVDCSDPGNVAAPADGPDSCVIYRKRRDLLNYPISCRKTLKLRVNKGVSGQLMLRVVAKNYNTAIDEADATRGYTYWNSGMMMASIKAKVKPIAVGTNLDFVTNGYGTALPQLQENGAGSLFASSPFAGMEMHANTKITTTAWQAHKSQFSRSTRTNLEFIECTTSAEKLKIETLKEVPRFRIGSAGADENGVVIEGKDFHGNYSYSTDIAGHDRLYQTHVHNSADAPDIHQLKIFQPHLYLRSYNEMLSNGWQWNEAAAAIIAEATLTDGTKDSWHGGYSGDKGLCLKTKLTVYEPSTCDSETHTSTTFTMNVPPLQISDMSAWVNPLSVAFEQTKKLYLEDEMVKLRISVNHDKFDQDSLMFYFSHIDIEDMYHDDDDVDGKHYGGNFQLFSYGNTVAPSSGSSNAIHAEAARQAGIGLLAEAPPGMATRTWRSFANKCTRHIYEQPGDGGFSGDSLTNVLDANVDHLKSAQACLDDARRQGGLIWGGAQDTDTREGVWMRPCRKCTINTKLKVTVYAFDGDMAKWHSGGSMDTATGVITLAHAPQQTRYNQKEVSLGTYTDLDENGVKEYNIDDTGGFWPAKAGIGVPLPLRDQIQVDNGNSVDVHVCTYIQEANLDEYAAHDDATVELYRDKICNPAGTSVDVNIDGVDVSLKFAYQGAGMPNGDSGCKDFNGYYTTCEKVGNADRASRMEMETLVLFDESEVSHNPPTDTHYLGAHATIMKDGSKPWNVAGTTDQMMIQPEQVTYQPAGNNDKAQQNVKQWYRIEACDASEGTISNAYWCTDGSAVDAASAGAWVTTGTGNDAEGSLPASYDCDISAKGASTDTVDANANSITADTNALLNSDSASNCLRDSCPPERAAGFSRHFWMVERASLTAKIGKGKLCVRGLSHFNTETDSTRQSPINLRLFAVVKDTLEVDSEVLDGDASGEATARSRSDGTQGMNRVKINSKIQEATVQRLQGMWESADGVARIEERNDHGRLDGKAPPSREWQELEAMSAEDKQLYGMTGALVPNVDCIKRGNGDQITSDTFCMDRLHYTEAVPYHDQHLGRIKIKAYMQKTCPKPDGSRDDTWHDANALFDTWTYYIDDYTGVGDDVPGEGLYRISDSWRQQNVDDPNKISTCPGNTVNEGMNKACLVVNQLYEPQSGTVNMWPVGPGYPIGEAVESPSGTSFTAQYDTSAGLSHCDVENDGGTENTNLRQIACEFTNDDNVLGRNTNAWSNTKLYRVVGDNGCTKQDGTFDLNCPDGPLKAREIVPNIRLKLPEKWSNCLRFRFSVDVGNEDRNAATAGEWNEAKTQTSTANPNADLLVEPQPRAEEPYMFIQTDLSQTDDKGFKAIGDLETGRTYIDPDDSDSDVAQSLKLGATEANTRLQMIAGYQSQIRISGGSHASDEQPASALVYSGSTTDIESNYVFDTLRESLATSGETVYLTIQSKYSKLGHTTGGQPILDQKFCVWVCSDPLATSCPKTSLVRLQGLQEPPASGTDEYDFSEKDGKVYARNVNGGRCADPFAKDTDGNFICDEFGYEKKDPYGRNPNLVGCPSATDTSDHKPSSRYSFRCTRGGDCPELKNVYIQYPSDQVSDDLLEISLYSRQDWKNEFQRVRATMNILMQPSITLSSVEFSALAQDSRQTCLDADPQKTWCCDADNVDVACNNPVFGQGLFGYPLQPEQSAKYRSTDAYPLQLTVYESQLHGDGTACSTNALNTPDISTLGSDSWATTECGMRAPIKFPDPDLSTVAPVGVAIDVVPLENVITSCTSTSQVNCLAETGITNPEKLSANKIAQSLAMPCSTYSLAATNPDEPVQCVGRFVVVNQSVLQYPEYNDDSFDATTRVVADSTNFKESAYNSRFLEWKVGDKMSRKEVVLVGSDENQLSTTDYSFSNSRCEKVRQFALALTPQAGYNPSIVKADLSNIIVSVKDDDYYGVHQLAYYLGSETANLGFAAATSHVELTRTGTLLTDFAHRTPLTTWQTSTDGSDALTFYLQRSRTAAESEDHSFGADSTPAFRAGWKQSLVKMHGSKAIIEVDADTIPPTDWEIRWRTTEGRGQEDVGTWNIISGSSIAADSNSFAINMAECLPQDAIEISKDCSSKLENDEAMQCECASYMPTGVTQVPFQWIQLQFVSKNPAAGCGGTGNKTVAFNIQDVTYPDNAEAMLQGTSLTGCERNPLPGGSTGTSVKFVLVSEQSDSKIYDEYPWRIVWAGLQPSLEAPKDAPLTWYGSGATGCSAANRATCGPIFGAQNPNGGNNYLSITETEHSQCEWGDATSGGSPCQQRGFRMHFCLKKRTDETTSSTWDNFGKMTTHFFVDMKDNVNEWAKINKDYKLSCPPASTFTADMLPDGVTANPRYNKVKDIKCEVYARKRFEYKFLYTSGDEVDREKAVPCTTQQEFEQVCNDVDTNQKEPKCLSYANDWDTYCSNTTDPEAWPLRLKWYIQTEKDEGTDFECPIFSESTMASDATWEKLPYVEFETVADGKVGLSKRPELCMENQLVASPLDKTAKMQCTAFGQGGSPPETGEKLTGSACIPLRIQDDSVFLSTNSHDERDLSVFEAEFATPVWDSDNGKINIEITDRYFDDGNERTLMNFGVGRCPTNSEAIWEQATDNPMKEARSAFGDCDFLQESDYNQADLQSLFTHLYGEDSYQPPEGAWTEGSDPLFGAITLPQGQGKYNALFKAPRNWPNNGNKEWHVSKAALNSTAITDNEDLSARGIKAKFVATIEEMQKCLLAKGGNDDDNEFAMATEVDDATGNTVYKFHMSATHITARRKGDASYAFFSSQCVDREYTLYVGSTLMSLSGIRTTGSQAETNAVYVDSMGYVTEAGYCGADSAGYAAQCQAEGSFNSVAFPYGPNHGCDTGCDTCADLDSNGKCDDGSCDPVNLAGFEYSVNLDMKVIKRFMGNTEVGSYYAVSSTDTSTDAVQADADNCYGAAFDSAIVTKGTKRDGAGNIVDDPDVTRSTLKFRTGCLNLLNGANQQQADVFSNCADSDNPDSTKSDTDFSFQVRIWECTQESELLDDGSNQANPAAGASCQQLPDWFRVSIAMSFIEQPGKETFQAPFTKLMQFYRDVDHRDENGDFRTGAQLETWRSNQILSASQADPFIKYSADAAAVFSLGFKEGSPLEATLATALRDVRLCEFRKPCYMAGYTPAEMQTELPACTDDNMLTDETHSPLALWARNQVMTNDALANAAADPGCADEANLGKAGKSCLPTQLSSTESNPIPYLTCDQFKWEDWLIQESQEIISGSDVNRQDRFVSTQDTVSSQFNLVRALNPVKSSQILISRGGTTNYARDLYGSCEDTTTVVTGDTATFGDDPTPKPLFHRFPDGSTSAGVGVCTCKGTIAANYQDAEGNKPYVDPANRQVIYSKESYTGVETHPSLMHLCPMRQNPWHSKTKSPVTSVDTFMMGLRNLRRNVEYFFEAVAIQYDTQAFDDLAGPPAKDQFHFETTSSSSRRMLSMPVAAISKRAQQHYAEDQARKSRNLLSAIIPLSQVMTTQAVMPQGPPQYQAADPATPITTSGSAGFIITGPATDASTTADFDAQDTADGIQDSDPAHVKVDKRFKKVDKNPFTGFFGTEGAGEAVWGSMEHVQWNRVGDALNYFFPFQGDASAEDMVGNQYMNPTGMMVGAGLLPMTAAAVVATIGLSATAAAVANAASAGGALLTMVSLGRVTGGAKRSSSLVGNRQSTQVDGITKGILTTYCPKFISYGKFVDEKNDVWTIGSHFGGSVVTLFAILFSEVANVVGGYYAFAFGFYILLGLAALWDTAMKRCDRKPMMQDFVAACAHYLLDFRFFSSGPTEQIPSAEAKDLFDLPMVVLNPATAKPVQGYLRWQLLRAIVIAIRIFLLIFAPMWWLWSIYMMVVYFVLHCLSNCSESVAALMPGTLGYKVLENADNKTAKSNWADVEGPGPKQGLGFDKANETQPPASRAFALTKKEKSDISKEETTPFSV